MTTALATTLPNESEFDVMVRTAKSLVQSGFLPSAVKTPQQAVAILMMSRELGIGAWAGLNGINVIAGKPTISPQLMLALINRSGELENIKIEGDDKSCTVTMTRRGREPHSETFTMKEAERMMTQEWVNGEKKTIPLSQKYNWRQMPATMLKWRAVSACARVVFPDVIIGFYTPEEIDPSVTVDMETGEIVERPAPAGNGKPAPEPPAIEEGEVVGQGEDEKKPHWIDDPKVRAKFWAYTKNDLGLEKDEVYDALGVKSIHDFDDTMQAAKDKLDVYADAKSSKPKPTQPEASEPPPWDEGHDTPLFPDADADKAEAA